MREEDIKKKLVEEHIRLENIKEDLISAITKGKEDDIKSNNVLFLLKSTRIELLEWVLGKEEKIKIKVFSKEETTPEEKECAICDEVRVKIRRPFELFLTNEIGEIDVNLPVCKKCGNKHALHFTKLLEEFYQEEAEL